MPPLRTVMARERASRGGMELAERLKTAREIALNLNRLATQAKAA